MYRLKKWWLRWKWMIRLIRNVMNEYHYAMPQHHRALIVLGMAREIKSDTSLPRHEQIEQLRGLNLLNRDFGIRVSGQKEMEDLLRKIQELSKKNQLLQEKACKEKNICSDQPIGK